MTNRERILKNILKYNQRLLFDEYAKPITVEGTAKITELNYIVGALRKRIKERKNMETAQMQLDFRKRNWRSNFIAWLRS